jgi:hypothetical protein
MTAKLNLGSHMNISVFSSPLGIKENKVITAKITHKHLGPIEKPP